jgi:hypothetical protein
VDLSVASDPVDFMGLLMGKGVWHLDALGLCGDLYKVGEARGVYRL